MPWVSRGLVWMSSGMIGACSFVVDPAITYRECDDLLSDDFAEGTTLENLIERCWELDNTDTDETTVEPKDISVVEGDVVIKSIKPKDELAQWVGDRQAPMIFQRVDGNFVAVARLEVLRQIDGAHCLEAGNAVGWVFRPDDAAKPWSAFFLSPLPASMVPDHRCDDPESPIPLRVSVRRRGAMEVFEDVGSAADDGEADIALCRFNDTIRFYFRDPESTVEAPNWRQMEEQLDAPEGSAVVGLTAAGAPSEFEVEGHFTWVGFARLGDDQPDGCSGGLDRLPLPAID